MFVKLKRLHLENLQSWKDEVVEFSDGLNAIIGVGDSNNTGKSVIFKALKLVCNPNYFTRQERKKLIRYGSDFARIHYYFSDGSEAHVTLTHQKVLYDCVFNGESVCTETVPPEKLLELLSVIVEPQSGYMVNVLDSEQSMLLVKSDRRSNYDLIKTVTEHSELNRLLDLYKEKYLEYNGYHIKTSATLSHLERQLNSLEIVDIQKLEEELSVLKSCEYAINVADFLASFVAHFSFTSDVDWELIIKTLNVVNIGDIELRSEVSLESIICLLDILKDVPKTVPNNFDWGILRELLAIEMPVNVSEFPIVSCLFPLFDIVKDLEDLLKSLDEIEETLNHIKSIDFNGTKYDCPIYGTIVYENGKCVHGGDFCEECLSDCN